MASTILRKSGPHATKRAGATAGPLRSVALISRALPITPDMEADVRLHLRSELCDLADAIDRLKGLQSTLAFTEDSFAFAIDPIHGAAIGKFERIHGRLQQTASMLAPAAKEGGTA